MYSLCRFRAMTQEGDTKHNVSKLYVLLKTLDFFKRFSPHLHFFLTFNDTNYLQKKNIIPDFLQDEWQ